MRQIKIPEDSRRKSTQRFVFGGESPATLATQLCSTNNGNLIENNDNASHSRKRRRSEGEEYDDSDSDFYGFAADSFLFDEERVSRRNFLSTPNDLEFPRSDVDEREMLNLANDIEANPEDVRNSNQILEKRSSKRKAKKRRKQDYVYY